MEFKSQLILFVALLALATAVVNGNLQEDQATVTERLLTEDARGPCENDENFGYKGDTTKDCDWVATKINKCRKKQPDTDKKVEFFCPQTCERKCSKCGSDKIPFRLELLLDNYNETSWSMTKVSDGSIVDEGSENEYKKNTAYNESLCLPNGEYSFTIFDGYGDGLTQGAGHYYGFLDNIEIVSGREFEKEETTTFTVVVDDPNRGKCENLELFDCVKKASKKKKCTKDVPNTDKTVEFYCPLNCKSECATDAPTEAPTKDFPSVSPSTSPSVSPSAFPSDIPSSTPSSLVPTNAPTKAPTNEKTNAPTIAPSAEIRTPRTSTPTLTPTFDEYWPRKAQ